MGNSNSRRYTFERPYGYPFRSNVNSQMRFPIGSTDRFAVSLSELPDVVNENYTLYQLALARRDIYWNVYLRDRWIHCDLKCTPEGKSLPHQLVTPVLPQQPALRHTASDEELDRAAIELCRRKRLLPPCTTPPATKPLVCTKNTCDVLANRMKDICERKCFWRRYLSGELEGGDGGVGAALRVALEAPPLTCDVFPSGQSCIPSPPCAGHGLPVRPPLFVSPQETSARTCPVPCPGASPVPVSTSYTSEDMQRILNSAWLTGMTSTPGNPTFQPSVPYTQTNSSAWVPPQFIPPQTTWNQTTQSCAGCTSPCPSNTQGVSQYQNPIPPPSFLQSQPPSVQLQPSLQPPAPSPPQAHPMQQPCPPAHAQFAEALEVGSTGVGDLSVAVYADGVVEARARGVQSQCGRLIRCVLSRRWRLPAGIRPDALWCFLGSGRLAVVALPPPPALVAVLRAMQCLGRPPLVPCAFAQACGVALS